MRPIRYRIPIRCPLSAIGNESKIRKIDKINNNNYSETQLHHDFQLAVLMVVEDIDIIMSKCQCDVGGRKIFFFIRFDANYMVNERLTNERTNERTRNWQYFLKYVINGNHIP